MAFITGYAFQWVFQGVGQWTVSYTDDAREGDHRIIVSGEAADKLTAAMLSSTTLGSWNAALLAAVDEMKTQVRAELKTNPVPEERAAEIVSAAMGRARATMHAANLAAAKVPKATKVG